MTRDAWTSLFAEQFDSDGELAGKIFDRFDADGSGAISEDEITAFFESVADGETILYFLPLICFPFEMEGKVFRRCIPLYSLNRAWHCSGFISADAERACSGRT